MSTSFTTQIAYNPTKSELCKVDIKMPTNVIDMMNGEGDIYIVNPYFPPSGFQEKFAGKQAEQAIINCKHLFDKRPPKEGQTRSGQFEIYNMPMTFIRCNDKYTQYFSIIMKNAKMSFINHGLTRKEAVANGGKCFEFKNQNLNIPDESFKTNVETFHRMDKMMPDEIKQFERIVELEHKCLVTTCFIYSMMRARLGQNTFSLVKKNASDLGDACVRLEDGSIDYYRTILNIINNGDCPVANHAQYKEEDWPSTCTYDFADFVTYAKMAEKEDGNTGGKTEFQQTKIQWYINVVNANSGLAKPYIVKSGNGSVPKVTLEFGTAFTGISKKWNIRSILNPAGEETRRDYSIFIMYSATPNFGTKILKKGRTPGVRFDVDACTDVRTIYKAYGSTKDTRISITGGVTFGMRGYMHSRNMSYQFAATEIFYQKKKSNTSGGAEVGMAFADIMVDASDSNDDNDDANEPQDVQLPDAADLDQDN